MCDVMPGNPWLEAEMREASLERILALEEVGPGELERLAQEASSPVLRGLARIVADASAANLPSDLAGLASPDPAVRLAAARELTKSGKPDQLPLLKRRFVQEETVAVRLLLLDAVANVGGQEQWPFLAGALRDSDRAVRLRAVEMAARFAPHAELIQTVLYSLKDPDAGVRDKAMGLLMIAGSRKSSDSRPPELPELALENSEKLALARRLLQERDRDMLPLLRRLAADDEPAEVVSEALRTLAVLGGPPEVELIRESLRRPEPEILARALLVLAQLGDRASETRASELATGKSSPAVRAAALVYLDRFEAPHPQAGQEEIASPADLDSYVASSLQAIRENRGTEIALYEPAPRALVRAVWPPDRVVAASALAALAGSLTLLVRWLLLGM